MRNINTRNRPGEEMITLDYLTKLHNMHEKIIAPQSDFIINYADDEIDIISEIVKDIKNKHNIC
jgi:hypothetical protein